MECEQILMPTMPFPPAGGVGVMRKAKMVKYFARMGIKVHVITTHNVRQVNTWEEDIINPNIIIKKIPSLSIWNFLRNSSNNFLMKNLKRILYFTTSYIYFIDLATLWGIILIPYTIYYLKKNNISVIYCSGAPFSTLWHMAIVKKILGSKVTYVGEWRDIWSDDFMIPSYVFPKKFFYYIYKKIEDWTLKKSDIVITVTETISNMQKAKLNKDKDKVITIENGFDLDDYIIENTDNKLKLPNINVSYMGSMVGSRRDAFYLFLNAIRKFTDNFGNKFKINLIGFELPIEELKSNYADLIEKDILNILVGTTPKKAKHFIQNNSDFLLMLMQKEYPDALSAKFFEYIAMTKPIICIAPRGELEKKIVDNNIGVFLDFNEAKIYDALVEIANNRVKISPSNFEKILKSNNFEFLAQKVWNSIKEKKKLD